MNMQMLEAIIMAKRVCITMDDECIETLNRLISKPSRTLFISLAIKYFKDTKEGQNFLLEEPYKDEIKDKKLNFSNKDNNFLQNDKKIKLDEWV